MNVYRLNGEYTVEQLKYFEMFMKQMLEDVQTFERSLVQDGNGGEVLQVLLEVKYIYIECRMNEYGIVSRSIGGSGAAVCELAAATIRSVLSA